MKLLIDECLSTKLVQVGVDAGYETYHVAHKGMGGMLDPQLAPVIFSESYTFVTNNARDFRKLHGKTDIHAGLIIIVPQVGIEAQVKIFRKVLEHLHNANTINQVVEVNLEGGEIVINQYSMPEL